MKKDERPLLTRVLKDVSRSFYLSLRLLPEPMREAAGVGYLLARASDTIADTSGVSLEKRMALLKEYGMAMESGGVWKADEELLVSCTQGERVLVCRIEEVFAAFAGLAVEERVLVVDVLRTILSGQMLDLQRGGAEGEMMLHGDADLWDYCDRVAGCVGDFWTRLGYLTLGEKFSTAPLELMCAAGKSLGRGLQLVNILRDLPEDMAKGRYYLPDSHGLTTEELMRLIARWIVAARVCVEEGLVYAREVRDRRARAASVMPAMLALDTLDLLAGVSWNEMKMRVKVGRMHVFRTCVEAWIYR